MASKYDSMRLTTNGGIRYALMNGFPILSGSQDAMRATEKYLMRGRDVNAFMEESIPAPYVLFPYVIHPPRRRYPGTSVLITQDVTFEPHSKDLPGDPLLIDDLWYTDRTLHGETYSEFYEVTINYSTETIESTQGEDGKPDETKPETFLERSMNAGGEILGLDPTHTKVDEGVGFVENSDVVMRVAKVIPTIEWSMRWKYALRPNWEFIFETMGKVNDDDLDIFEGTAEQETVLFMGVSGQQQYIWNGLTQIASPWSLDFKFSQRFIREGLETKGWNHAFHHQKGWLPLRRASEGANDAVPLYDDADFLKLFQAAPT